MMIENAQDLTSEARAQPCLLREDHGPIAVLTLNRPKARNSLSVQLLEALRDAFVELSATNSIHAVIITGAPPAFCAGHDLREMTEHRADPDRGRVFFDRVMRICSEVMQAIMRCPKPIIASVGGIATAAGCQLVASCDLAVASQEARFATPGVNIGLFCSTPMVALSRNVSRKHAMEMLLLGEMIAAEKAAEIGLVNRVVAPDQVMPASMELASAIASKAPLILKIGKEAFYNQIEMPVAEAYDYASRVMVENMLERDAEEGIGAFVEKRPPNWSEL